MAVATTVADLTAEDSRVAATAVVAEPEAVQP